MPALTEKQRYYIQTLCQDFFAELNDIAGLPHTQPSDRAQHHHPFMNTLRPLLTPMFLEKPALSTRQRPYTPEEDTFLYERFYEAAEAAADYYADTLDNLSLPDIQHLAYHHVDKIFSYMTQPIAHHSATHANQRRWIPEHLFYGIVEGDAALWVLAVNFPDNAIKTLHDSKNTPTPQAFWPQWKPRELLVIASVASARGNTQLIKQSHFNSATDTLREADVPKQYGPIRFTAVTGDYFIRALSSGYTQLGRSRALHQLTHRFVEQLTHQVKSLAWREEKTWMLTRLTVPQAHASTADSAIQDNLTTQTTTKQTLFREIVARDFFGELNYMAGCADRRSPERLALMGTLMTHYQRNLPRTNAPGIPFQPYSGSLLQEYITDTAYKITLLYAEALESLTEEDIRRLAVGGVDRLLAYMTLPNQDSPYQKWRADNFLKGFIQGNPQHWVCSLSQRHLTHSQYSSLDDVYITHAPADPLTPAEEEKLRRAPTYSSEDALILNMGVEDLPEDYAEIRAEDERERSEALYRMALNFEQDYQRYLFNPSPQVFPTTLNPLNIDHTRNTLSSPTDRMSTISQTPTLDTLHLPSEDDEAVLAMKVRGHRMALRHALQDNSDAWRFSNFQARPTLNGTPKLTVEDKNNASLDTTLKPFLSPTLSERLFHQPLQRCLMRGEPDSFESFLLPQLSVILNNQSNTPIPWTLIFIDPRQIHWAAFNEKKPFLPQYIEHVLGYSANSVIPLKNHYRFLFVFNELNHFPSPWRERLYFGEETANWPTAKIIFTAPSTWQPPVRKKMVPVKELSLAPLRGDQVNLTLPWYEDSDGNDDPNYYTTFLNQHRDLLKLMRPFSIAADTPFNPDFSHQSVETLMNSNDTSPTLLNVLIAVIPLLPTDETDWPTNRHELYGYWLKKKIGDIHHPHYLTLKRIAIQCYLHKALYVEEPVANVLLSPQTFLSVTHPSEQKVRYAFLRHGWQDYLVAKTLMESLTDEGNLMHPAQHLWNSADWTTEYPGILDFLTEFLETDADKSEKMAFLYQRWVANGSLIAWENAYTNVAALLKRLTPNPEALVLHSQEFLYTSATREMQMIEALSEESNQLKLCVFDALGHGTGISGASARTVEGLPERYQQRRYIRANAIDCLLADAFVKQAYHTIDAADLEKVRQMVPDYSGCYSHETQWETTQLTYDIRLDCDETEYLEKLMDAVNAGSPERTPRELLIDLKAFRAKEKNRWLDEKKLAYQESLEENEYWMNPKGKLIARHNKRAVTREVNRYRAALEALIDDTTLAAKEAILQEPTPHEQEGEGSPLLEATPLERFHQYIDSQKKLNHHACQQREKQIKAAKTFYQELTEGTLVRFEVLMNQSPVTQAIYASYTDAEKRTLATEIENGELHRLIDRFRPHFAFSHYKTLFDAIGKNLHTRRREAFIQRLEGPVPHGHEAHTAAWKKLQEEWGSTQEEYLLDKDYILKAIGNGYDKKAEKRLDELFSPETLALFEPFLRQTIQESIQVKSLDTVQPELDSYFASSRIWQKMTSAEKHTLSQRLLESRLAEKNGDALLKAVLSDYSALFIQPTEEFLKRYLRFGLVVDACTAEYEETLLLHALRALGHAMGAHGRTSDTTDQLFEIIQHLFNAGAKLLATNTQNHLRPRDYVTNQRIENPKQAYWFQINNAMNFLSDLQERQIDVEQVLLHMVQELINCIHCYKKKLDADTDSAVTNFIARWSQYFRLEDIKSHREKCVHEFPRRIEKMRSNLFGLLHEFNAMEEEMKKFPNRTHVGTSRLAKGMSAILKHTKKKLDLHPNAYAIVTLEGERGVMLDKAHTSSSWSLSRLFQTGPSAADVIKWDKERTEIEVQKSRIRTTEIKQKEEREETDRRDARFYRRRDKFREKAKQILRREYEFSTTDELDAFLFDSDTEEETGEEKKLNASQHTTHHTSSVTQFVGQHFSTVFGATAKGPTSLTANNGQQKGNNNALDAKGEVNYNRERVGSF